MFLYDLISDFNMWRFQATFICDIYIWRYYVTLLMTLVCDISDDVF